MMSLSFSGPVQKFKQAECLPHLLRTVFINIALLLWLGASLSFAQDRISSAIDSSERIVLGNSVHPTIVQAQSSQPVSVSFPLDHMILSLQPSASQDAALQQLLKEQQDPASPNFHSFLTPAQFGSQFGLSENDLNKLTGWLVSNGFQIDEVAANRLAIVFSGNAGQVASAFNTEIRQYIVQGAVHYANATAPQIPAALAPVVSGFVRLNNFQTKSPALSLKKLYNAGGGTHYLVPADFAVIYDLNPLFSSGISGTGQHIAIVSRSNINTADVDTFRLDYGLPANTVTPIFATGSDPGIATNGDDIEATLDVEWAAATAPKASIDLVMAASTATSDGVDLASQYAVNNNLAPILSVSFGACESSINNSFYNTLWRQAAAQGISVFVAAGDSGAAGCDSSSDATGTVRAVNGLCSTPYSTCVGGTLFDDSNPSTYWYPGNNAVMGSAISYIPEVAWNESALVTGGAGLTAGGGGVSSVYLKPFWQVAPGVPADGYRDVPDVALTAAQHDGYIMIYQGIPYIVSGTSAATPSFAGIMALVTQKYGASQGVINQVLYPLAARGAVANAKPIFHDVTSGNNSVPGVTGYSATPGYDLATGLGSVDATQLVANWASLTGGFSLTASALAVSVSPFQNTSITFTVADLGTFHGAVAFSIAGVPPGVVTNFVPGTVNGSGSSALSIAANSATSGTYPLTVTASGGGYTRSVSFSLTVNVSTNCALVASPVSLTVVQSQATSTKLVCGSSQGIFAANLVLTITGTPAGVSTSFTPASLTAGTGLTTLLVNATSLAAPGSYTLKVTATLPNSTPAFSSSINIPLSISSPNTFLVTSSSANVSIAQGGTGTFVLTSLHSGAFDSSISFSTSGLPSTIAASLAPAGVVAAPGDGTVTITLQSASVVPVGSYTMTVLAQGAGLILRIPLSVQVTAAPAFTLTASSATLTLRQSTATTPGTANLTFNVGTLTNGFNSAVSLSVSGLPSGVTGVFSVPTLAIPGSGSSVLTLTASATATTGISMITVTATGGTILRALNVRLITTPPPTFTIAVSLPTYNIVAGNTLTETITATGLYGFTSNLTLSAVNHNAGLTVSFLSTSIAGLNGTTTMTIQSTSSVAPGVYPFTVVATDPVSMNTQSAAISLQVGTVTTTLSTPGLTIAVNTSGSLTITTTANLYTGTVALSVANLPFGLGYSLSLPYIASNNGSSLLTLTASSAVQTGTYILTVRSVVGGIASTVPLTLVVN